MNSGKKKPLVSTPIKIGAVAVLALVLFGWGYLSIGAWTYSEGERTGVVTKFSHKGMAIKTWEGELNMGGFDQGGVGSSWKFSVGDPDVVEKVKEAQRAGGRWSLMYRQQNWVQSWKGAKDYFVTDVQQASKPKSSQ